MPDLDLDLSRPRPEGPVQVQSGSGPGPHRKMQEILLNLSSTKQKISVENRFVVAKNDTIVCPTYNGTIELREIGSGHSNLVGCFCILIVMRKQLYTLRFF